ncbi:hypothetical protein quinque_007073 [Culex quinquefasciatus]
MTSKAALLTVVLAISLTTSNSAIPLHNRTSPTPKQPGLATTLYLRAGFHPPEQRYFVFNSREVDFFQAWHLCASIGLRLASVNTAEDDAALKLALRAADSNQIGPWWIAGTDLGKHGHFLWITTARPLGYRTGYTNFAPGQPDNTAGREHCVEAGYPSGTLWNDRHCDTRRSGAKMMTDAMASRGEVRDRHVKKNGDGQPVVDSSQDYVLLLGYENQTHTVLRFKRKLDTCDVAYDVPITVSCNDQNWGWLGGCSAVWEGRPTNERFVNEFDTAAAGEATNVRESSELDICWMKD